MPRKLLTGADFNLQAAINAADATTPTGLVTKQQLDNAVDGRAWKQPVRAASTTNGTLATAFANGQTLDGVTLTTGMRILLKDQTAGSENMIGIVQASGAPVRASDADTTAELNNATVYVIAGTTNADKAFTQTANDPTPGTTALVWAQVGGGTQYTGSQTVLLSGTAFSVIKKSGGGLAEDAGGLYVDPAGANVVKKYAADVPSGSTTATMTHNLGTVDRLGEPMTTIKSTGEIVEPDVVLGVNADTLTFATAPTTGQYRYTTAV